MAQGVRAEGRKTRGNPNWGKTFVWAAPAKPTQYERLLAEMGYGADTPHSTIAASVKVRTWVTKHYGQRYVPEWLLEHYALDPNDKMTFGKEFV